MTEELWLACGQSNMELVVQDAAEPAGPDDPMLNLFHIPVRDTDAPCADVQPRWSVPAREFSAVAYHFGRDHLVLSQMAQTCQRSVRFWDSGRDYIYLRTYRNGYYEIPENLLFDIGADSHEQQDLAVTRPDLVQRAARLLDTWREEMLAGHRHEDPLVTVLSEPPEEDADKYRERLRQTGRGNWANALFSRESEKVGLDSRRKFQCLHGIYGGTEMIISDQHRYSAMGHAGDPNIETPAMDRLAGEGPFC